jgi:diacylglycerol kinase family enzyme
MVRPLLFTPMPMAGGSVAHAAVHDESRIGSPRGPLVIVMNTRSGAGDRQRTLATLAAVFGEAGVEHEVLQVSRPKLLPKVAQDAVARATRNGGVVVAAGGDGTINTVAQAVLDSELPFGVLPHGTFNYFSRTHGIPTDVEGAARTLVTGSPRAVQVGQLNERLFLVNASLGLYPRLLEEREAYKRRYGRTRWVALCSGLLTLLREHWQVLLRIEREGEPRLVKTSTLFVGNNALQLARIGIDEAPAVEQGRLVALSVRTAGRWSMPGLLLRGAAGRLGSDDQVTSFAFRHLEVEPVLRRARPVKMKVSIDGETQWMSTPLVFGVAPKPLWLIAPPAA